MISLPEISIADIKYINADAEDYKGKIVQTTYGGQSCLGMITIMPAGFQEVGLVCLTGPNVGNFEVFGRAEAADRHSLDVSHLVEMVLENSFCIPTRKAAPGDLLLGNTSGEQEFITPVFIRGNEHFSAYIKLTGSQQGDMTGAGTVIKLGSLGFRQIVRS